VGEAYDPSGQSSAMEGTGRSLHVVLPEEEPELVPPPLVPGWTCPEQAAARKLAVRAKARGRAAREERSMRSARAGAGPTQESPKCAEIARRRGCQGVPAGPGDPER
jgi:hypothetical protein